MGKKVLVLAGGFDQIALINELKERGIYVILADYYENPPAKLYADKHYQISTLDEEKIYQVALVENVDIITTACTDQALLTMARVSERLNLPTYISSETALNVTNKTFMKSCFAKNGIPTAKFVLLKNRKTWENEIDKLPEFPLVVKPCDCNSSKGVIRVNQGKELKSAIEEAFELSRSGQVIVEQFIEGREISIDIWLNQENVVVLSISESKKIKESNNDFLIYQSRYPVEEIDNYKEQIISIADDIARAFQLSNCPMLIQALIKNGNIYVIEFSARMGGGTKYKLIENISGIDIMKIYVERILGNVGQVVVPKKSSKYIELDYLYTDSGTVTGVVGFEECKKEGLIEDYFLYKPLNSWIATRKISGDRMAGILISGDTEKGLVNMRERVFDRIDILENKKSILYRACF
jgi:biotin carboxylase